MPGGRPKGSTKPKLMADALIVALNRVAEDGKTKKLAQVAQALVDRAVAGDVQAIREVFDRVEGKAPQGILLGNADDLPLRVSWLPLVK